MYTLCSRTETNRCVATIYAKNALRTHLNRKYAILLSEFLRIIDDTNAKYVRNISNSNFSNYITVCKIIEKVWTDCIQIRHKNNSTHDTYLAKISFQFID